MRRSESRRRLPIGPRAGVSPAPGGWHHRPAVLAHIFGQSPPSASAPASPRTWGATLGLLWATLVWTLSVTATAIVVTHTPERPVVVLYAAGRTLATGLLATVLWAGISRVGHKTRARRLALAALALCALSLLTVPEDLSGQMHDRFPHAPELATILGSLAVGLAPLFAGLAVRQLRPPLLRYLTLPLAVAPWVLNEFILHEGYPGAHLFLGLVGLAIFAGALSQVPRRRVTTQMRALWRITWAIAGVICLISLIPPSNKVVVHLLQRRAEVLTPYLTRLGGHRSSVDAQAPEAWRPWFASRADTPPVPTTPSSGLPQDPIVILVTIDSLRTDIFQDPHAPERLPNLWSLRERAVRFAVGRTPGSQTVYTITSLFTGTYFSQQYWTPHPGIRALWPDDDPSIRFPSILTDRGVTTVHIPTSSWLIDEFGVARGFAEEKWIKPKRTRFAPANETFPRMIRRLGAHDGGPMFMYTHALDTHVSMRKKPKKASDQERFWAALGDIDRQLGRLLAQIEHTGFASRTIVIISSDHGEGFGDHDTPHHAATLYEELIRVPLFAVIPGVSPRVVDQPVSVVDLGPTILDLFGVPTPGHMMGQSLVPLLAGREVTLSRPIAAEGRLKKAMVFSDGLKAIVDDRHHTEEVYDLGTDPGETSNLLDGGSYEAAERVAILRRFFAVHRIRRPGYEVPFRK